MKSQPYPTSPRKIDQKQDPVICRCNGVKRSTIEKAIQSGAKTLGEIFDQTSAGVGACGGSCRAKLQTLLDRNLKEV
jgi:bacterioferritin-associated ferredoxin